MLRRRLGASGPDVSGIGLGCMGLTGIYGAVDPAEAVRVIEAGIEAGVDFIDTAELYGPYSNEELVGRAIAGRRDRVFVATKFGYRIEGSKPVGLDSRPEHIREAVEGSLRRLRVECIDLLYQHRIDPAVAVEEVVGAMGRLVAEGKVRFLGLSKVDGATIVRGHHTHRITAVQNEYSLWERGAEDDALPTARRLGIGFVAYSPLGRGFLATSVAARDLEPDDYRRTDARFSEASRASNLTFATELAKVARAHSCSSAQVALAWLLAKGPDIVPIAGTTCPAHLMENQQAGSLALEPDEVSALERAVPRQAAALS